MEDDKTLLSRPSAQPPEGPDADVDLGSKFQILGTIGKGGMGSVLKVRHLAMDRLRAVKILHLDVASSDPSIIERFKREATVASDLQHPNIVRIFDFDHTPSGLPYIAMELLEGIDLQQLIGSKGPCSIERTVELLAGVADALDKVHAMGIVHRDLKPANLFLSSGGTVKILDFGISHVEWDGAGITETGDILGTPVFMSPEQLRGEEIDHRVDIYALAAVAYELITGHHAVEATNPAMLVAKILEGDRKPAVEHDPSIPEAASEALVKGMAQRPEDRFGNASALVEAIANGAGIEVAFAGPESVATAPTIMRTGAMLPKKRTEQKRSWKPIAVALGVAVLAAAAAMIWTLGGDEGGEPSTKTASLEGPILVLPADVEVSGADEEWTSTACATLFGRYLSLSTDLKVISSEEALARLQDRWRSPSSGDYSATSTAAEAEAGTFFELSLQGAFGDLRLEATARTRSGNEIWSRRASGEDLDTMMEELTWDLREIAGEGKPANDLDRSRCGTMDDELCARAITAERAILEHGLLRRMDRLAPELGERAETKMWKSISKTFACLESPNLTTCLDSIEIGLPPEGSPLSPSRKRLWRAMSDIATGEQNRNGPLCDLVGDKDPFVDGIASAWTVEADCPDRKQVICQRTNSFPLHYECMVKTAMYDDPATSLRYYDEFSERDLAHPMITSTFSMIPMRKDLALADRWLRRVRLRTSQEDPLLANSLVRIELARRNFEEAMVWARRSVNPLWREGQARLVAGQLRPGQISLLEGARDMLLVDDEAAPYVFHVIVRPAIQPILISRDPRLAKTIETIENADGKKLDEDSTGIIRIARAVRDGVPPDLCGGIDRKDPLAVELLYLCRDWEGLLELAEKRNEQSYAARASSFLVADAHLELGHLEEARRLFQTLQDDPISRGTLPASSIIALARLGEIAEKQGDLEGARASYAEMTKIWKAPDIVLPSLERARKKIEETGGPTTNIGAPEGTK